MLSKSMVERILDAALTTGGDYAEVFVEDKQNTSIGLIGGKIENALSGRDYGVGIRILDGFFSVYAYTNSIHEKDLIDTAYKAAAAIGKNRKHQVISLTESTIDNKMLPIQVYPQNVDKIKKADVMRKAYDVAFNYDPDISQVTVNYLDVNQQVLIANSLGWFKEDNRVRTRLSINAVASKGHEMQSGFVGPGGGQGFEFIENLDVAAYAQEASRVAKTMLYADYSPSGKMPVVIENGFGGVIFHEACGHGLEATSVAKGNSVFAGKLGQQVASEYVTAIDDGTIINGWGSSNIDDEGNPTAKNVLIEKGILKNYMVDLFNGRRMNMAPTGSTRRQSYRFAPTSRMTNTYIDNGQWTREGIISDTEKGLYAKKMGGGSVNPATGEFNFAVMEGYLIENGKITKPVRGATLIGTGIQVLNKIDRVGNNLLLGQGMCGSLSGSIPANVGQPTLRVSEITVGGREGE